LKSLFGLAPLLTSLYYDSIFEHLYFTYLFTVNPPPGRVPSTPLIISQSPNATIRNKKTATREQLEALKPLSMEQIDE
jgi:hypothetical protein